MSAFEIETLEPRQLLAGVKSAVSLATTISTPSVSLASVVEPAYAAQIGLTGKLDPTLTFDDEFDGTTLDLSKWQVREADRHRVTPNWPDMAVTDRSSVVVKNGELQLIAYTDPATGQYRSGWIQTDTNNGGATDPKLMSGSTAHFRQAYGYWEAKIKFSSLNGMWNAFWVHAPQVSNVGDDPAKANHPEIYGTEMDVVENGATFSYAPNQNNMQHQTIHANGYGTQHISSAAHNAMTDPYGYHTYGLMWDPNGVSVYVDGYQTYRETRPAFVSKVQHLAILSNEIGVTGSTDLGQGRAFWGLPPTTNGGYGSVTTSQAKMTVDYLRVWALTGTSPTNPNPTTPPTTTAPPINALPPAVLPSRGISLASVRTSPVLTPSKNVLETPIRSLRNDLTVGDLPPIL